MLHSHLSLDPWECYYCQRDLTDYYTLDEIGWTAVEEPIDWYWFDHDLYPAIKPDRIEAADMICCDQWYTDCECNVKVAGDTLKVFLRDHKITDDDIYDLSWDNLSNFDCSACDHMSFYSCIPLRNYVKYYLRKNKKPEQKFTPCRLFEPNYDMIQSYQITVPPEFLAKSKELKDS